MTSELRAGYNVRKYPTLRRFLNDTEHEVQAIMGPFGSGKSSASIVKLVEHGATIPAMRDGRIRARYLVARNTYRELQDTTIKTFFKWFPPIHCGNYNESKNTYLMRGMGEASRRAGGKTPACARARAWLPAHRRSRAGRN